MKRQSDHFTIKAKQSGYPARSVFKLKEIHQKFKILKGPVLDIGAAPGSWSLYCLNHGCKALTAVDIQPLTINRPGLLFIQGDINDPDIQKQLLLNGPYATIISDAAPKTTGNRTVDTTRSAALVENIIDLAMGLLKPDGSLVLKIFQGGAEQEIRRLLVAHFAKVKGFKPQASRDESFESFIIAIGYRKG